MAERISAPESYAGFALVERIPSSTPDIERWRAEGREGGAEVFLGPPGLLARARALPTGGPFPDVRAGERDGRAWVVVPGALAVDLAALQRRLGEGALAFGWHIAAAIGELHEQGGAHGLLHPAHVGLDTDGYLVIRPALGEAIEADPDPDAPAQAADCRQLASLLAALAPSEASEGPLALLLAGLRQDRARLRLQPGWAVRQALAVVLGRDPEREERLKAELGEGWALEQPFWTLMARHQPQPPIRPLAEEAEAYGRWVAGDSAVVQRPVAEALLTAAIRRQTPAAAGARPADAPAAPASPEPEEGHSPLSPEPEEAAARPGPARVILPFNRDDLIALRDAEEGEEDTGAQAPIELPFPERRGAARVQLPGPAPRPDADEPEEDGDASPFLAEEIPTAAFAALSAAALAEIGGPAGSLPASASDFDEEATVIGPAPAPEEARASLLQLPKPVADPGALEPAPEGRTPEISLPTLFIAPEIGPAVPEADPPEAKAAPPEAPSSPPSLLSLLRFPVASEPAPDASGDHEDTILSSAIALVDERDEPSADFADDEPTGVFAVLDEDDASAEEPSAFSQPDAPSEEEPAVEPEPLPLPAADPPPLRLVPSVDVAPPEPPPIEPLPAPAPRQAVPLTLAAFAASSPAPADLAEPALSPSAPAAAGREEPKWAGVRGVTGGSSREAELGAGKWTEPARDMEDIQRALPASPPRALDLGKDRPSWPIYAAAGALIAAVALGVLYRGPFGAAEAPPASLPQPLAAAASTVQVDVASGPAGQVRFDGRDYGRTPAGIPIPTDDAPRTLCVEQPDATTCLPVTRAELAAQGSVFVFDPSRAAPPR